MNRIRICLMIYLMMTKKIRKRMRRVNLKVRVKINNSIRIKGLLNIARCLIKGNKRKLRKILRSIKEWELKHNEFHPFILINNLYYYLF